MTGCTKQQEADSDGSSSDTATSIEWKVTNNSVSVSDSPVVFSEDDEIPLILNGSVKGYLRVNWVQRIGVWDWYNTNANVAGVKSSYTCNFHAVLNESNTEPVTLQVSGNIFTKDKKCVGNPCSVGWTGFSKSAQFYDKTVETDFEIGIQPEVLDVSDCYTVFSIVDSDGNQYDDIMFDSGFLNSAEDGVGIETDGRTVHSINGAAFTVGINSVSINDIYSVYEDTLLNRFYDLVVSINYNSAPANERESLLFDSKSKALRAKQIIGICSSIDSNVVFDGDDNATRQIYVDDTDLFDVYTTTEFRNLNAGESATYTTNRILNSKETPESVRVWIEFPEEAKARTLEEMKDFDGRFLVIQRSIEDRQMPTSPIDD